MAPLHGPSLPPASPIRPVIKAENGTNPYNFNEFPRCIFNYFNIYTSLHPKSGSFPAELRERREREREREGKRRLQGRNKMSEEIK